MTKPNPRQLAQAAEWADEWGEIRRQVIVNHRQQALELRGQGASALMRAQHAEARTYLLAALQALTSLSQVHHQDLTQKAIQS